MRTAVEAMEPLREEHWADLVGVPFERGGSTPAGIDCWGVVELVHRRRGLEVTPPGETARRLGRGEVEVDGWVQVPPRQERVGDVAVYRTPKDLHVAIVLDQARALHAIEGQRCTALSRSYMRRALLGYWRPGEGTVVAAPPETVLADRSSGCLVVECAENPLRPADRDRYPARCTGLPVASYLPEGWTEEEASIAVNGVLVEGEARATTIPQAGDLVTFVRRPGGLAIAAVLFNTTVAALTTAQIIVGVVIQIVLSIGLSFLVSLVTTPAKRSREQGEAEQSPTFSIAGIRNTYEPGRTIPVVIGKHRVGGQLIGVFNTIGDLFSTDGVPTDPLATQGSFDVPLTYGSNGFGAFITGDGSAAGGKTELNLLIAISEGEIGSVNGQTADITDLDSAQIPRGTLYVNGTDAADFAGVRMSVRLGTSGQAPVPGFEDTINAVAVERPLNQSEVWTYETVEAVDGFEVQIFEPNGHYRISSSGETHRKKSEYLFKWRPVGAQTWTETSTLTRFYAYRGSHSWSIRRGSLARDRYEISIERLTPDDDDESYFSSKPSEVSQAIVNAVNEIRKGGSSYPGIAIVAVKALGTDQLSGTPTVTSYVEEGKKFWCWDRIDPDNPSFVLRSTANPGEIYPGISLNRVFGLGRVRDVTQFDWDTWGELTDYCDEVIGDGRGGTMTRCRFDGVYDSAQKAGDFLDQVLAVARSKAVPIGTKIGVAIGRARTPAHLFTTGNSSDLVTSWVDASKRPDRVTVEFLNEELDYDFDAVTYPPDQSDDGGFLDEVIRMPGCTKPARAMRIAAYHYNLGQAARRTVQLRSAVEASLVQVGDIAWAATTGLRVASRSGRLLQDSASGTEVYLDRTVVIEAAKSYKVRVIAPKDNGNGTFELQSIEVAVTASAGTYEPGDSLACADLGITPTKQTSYAFGEASEYLTAYEITAASIDGDLVRQITGIEYNATVYDDDPGDVPAATDRLHDQRAMPERVTGLRFTEEIRVRSGGSLGHVVVAAWKPNYAFEEADVFVADLAEGSFLSWALVGRATGGSFEIGNLTVGQDIAVSVVPVSPMGHRRGPEGGTVGWHHVVGRLAPPAPPTGLRVFDRHEDLVVIFDEAADLDLEGTEFRIGDTWIGGLKVGFARKGVCPVHLPGAIPPGVSTKLMARSRNTSGITSLDYVSIDIERTESDRIAASGDEATAWAGTLTNFSVVSGELQGDKGFNVHTYETPRLDLLATLYARLLAFPRIVIADADDSWDVATEAPWDGRSGRARIWDDPGKLIDLPDGKDDALRLAWENGGLPWDGEYAKRRISTGLDETDFFQIVLESKTGTTTGEYDAAEWEPHTDRAATFRYYGFRLTIRVPGDWYLVSVANLYRAVLVRMSNPMTTQYDTLYGGANGEPKRLAGPGAGDYILGTDGGGKPTWISQRGTHTGGGLELIGAEFSIKDAIETLHGYFTAATAVGISVRAFIDSTDNYLGHPLPAGKTFKVLRAYGRAKAGATTGTTEIEVGLRRIEAGAALSPYTDFALATATGAEDTYIEPADITGTFDDPIAEISGGSGYRLIPYIKNGSTSPGALANVKHVVTIIGVIQ